MLYHLHMPSYILRTFTEYPSNIRNRRKIYLDVSRMLCRVIGGRTLLLRREQIVAMEEKRPVRRLFPFDYLIGIDGFSRMGAFYCRNDFPFGTKLG